MVIAQAWLPNIVHAEQPSPAYQKEIIDACKQASRLDDAEPAGRVVGFDDQLGMTAVVIDGKVAINRHRSRPGRVLCLFDKVTRKPFVASANALIREPAAGRRPRR